MQAIVHRVQVQDDGTINLPALSGASGSTVEVIILVPELDQSFGDLLKASESSTGFWDNPVDDEVWNNA
ncbi:MAG: hypothetical protein HYV26_00955 [Candidatus Hydrogenedentes bacterium]|nr:hypothetical protein [Candidatus Hydrogenedentota bacterium]